MKLEIHPTHPEPRKLRQVLQTLEKGGVVIYPTDTVYAIGCDCLQKKAIDRIYKMKRMKEDHPLALVCPDLGDISRYAVVDDRAYRTMRRMLPGPYTFILPATREVPRILMMKQKTVGIRVPHHEVALQIVRELGRPIVSSSTTWEGETLNDPDLIAKQFRDADMVLDSGFGGLDPSTVIDLTGSEPVIVRQGAGPTEGVI